MARNSKIEWCDKTIGDPLSLDAPPALGGYIDDCNLNNTDAERVGYPTQKPVSLVARLIPIATRPGDLVLDPACGSGTALIAARSLGRRALGIDCSADAIATAAKRLTAASVQASFDFGFAA